MSAKKKQPRKQTSPSDVKRRQTAKGRSAAAQAVRALVASPTPYITVPRAKPVLADQPARKRSTKAANLDLKMFQVYRDINGVAYLRVSITDRGAQFVVNKGFHVELVEIDRHSVSLLSIQPVVGSSILDCAKKLLHPLNDNVTISMRAKEHLEQIIENKEIQKMATTKTPATKPAKFATVNAPAAKTGKKSSAVAKDAKPVKKATSAKGAAPAAGRLDDAVIKVKAKENTLREGTFCHAQLAAAMKSNGKTVAHAQKILDGSGQNPNQRRIEIAWLTKKGFITTAQA